MSSLLRTSFAIFSGSMLSRVNRFRPVFVGVFPFQVDKLNYIVYMGFLVYVLQSIGRLPVTYVADAKNLTSLSIEHTCTERAFGDVVDAVYRRLSSGTVRLMWTSRELLEDLPHGLGRVHLKAESVFEEHLTSVRERHLDLFPLKRTLDEVQESMSITPHCVSSHLSSTPDTSAELDASESDDDSQWDAASLDDGVVVAEDCSGAQFHPSNYNVKDSAFYHLEKEEEEVLSVRVRVASTWRDYIRCRDLFLDNSCFAISKSGHVLRVRFQVDERGNEVPDVDGELCLFTPAGGRIQDAAAVSKALLDSGVGFFDPSVIRDYRGGAPRRSVRQKKTRTVCFWRFSPFPDCGSRVQRGDRWAGF